MFGLQRMTSFAETAGERIAALLLQVVIGAGAAGLVTARELLREGHTVTLLEHNNDMGGVWRYTDDSEEDKLGLQADRRRVYCSL